MYKQDHYICVHRDRELIIWSSSFSTSKCIFWQRWYEFADGQTRVNFPLSM